MRVMSVAHDAPGLASSVNIGAFNLGNAFRRCCWCSCSKYAFSVMQLFLYTGARLSLAALGLVLLQIKLNSKTIPCSAIH